MHINDNLDTVYFRRKIINIIIVFYSEKKNTLTIGTHALNKHSQTYSHRFIHI